MSKFFVLIVSLLLYIWFVPLVPEYMGKEYRAVTISFPPDYRILRGVSMDHRLLVGQYLTVKVITWFGGRHLTDENSFGEADYYRMYRNLETATRLDPYNIDAYYFAQSILPWEAGQIEVANALLDYGMKFRIWDYYLPFFAAFNCSHFLKNYDCAASYYKKAAELTGNDLFMRLASRNFYEAGKTDEALLYLKVMIESSRNSALKQMLTKRYNAFNAVKTIEQARNKFMKSQGRLPVDLTELLSTGFIVRIPEDPYKGNFYIDKDGIIRSSSNFSEGAKSGATAETK